MGGWACESVGYSRWIEGRDARLIPAGAVSPSYRCMVVMSCALAPAMYSLWARVRWRASATGAILGARVSACLPFWYMCSLFL